MTKGYIYLVKFRGKNTYKAGFCKKLKRRMYQLRNSEFDTPMQLIHKVRIHNYKNKERYLHSYFGRYRAPIMKRKQKAFSTECYKLSTNRLNKVLRFMDNIDEKYAEYDASRQTL